MALLKANGSFLKSNGKILVTPKKGYMFLTRFSNFDVATLTDYPIEGSPCVYTKGSGTFTIKKVQNGLRLDGNYSYNNRLDASLDHDFFDAKKVIKTSKVILKRMTPYSWSWMWHNQNAANSYQNRGQGLFMFANNLTTDFVQKYWEYWGPIYMVLCVPISGQYYLDQEVEVQEVWTDDGVMKWYYNGVLAGTNTNVAMDNNLNDHLKALSMGVSDSEIICTECSIITE